MSLLQSLRSQSPAVEKETGLMTFWFFQWCNELFKLVDPAALAPLAITVGASPFVHQNASATKRQESVLVQGGTVTKIEISADGTTYFDTGVVAGMFYLSSQYFIKVTHAGAPTMTSVPH